MEHPSLTLHDEILPHHIELTGRPGRFLFIDDDDIDRVAMNLRVSDTSRATENVGTELPIVRESEMRTSVTLVNVPAASARYRLLLRIYGTAATTARVPRGTTKGLRRAGPAGSAYVTFAR